jgi:DNA processing protein
MPENSLLYKIAISLIPGIGCVNAKRLIAYTGSIEGIFKEKKQHLLKIPGIGEILANEIVNANVLQKAEDEIKFIEKHKIKVLFYLDKDYPSRLRHCADSPILLYSKGNLNFESPKVLSIVGTRHATDYGKDFCEKLVANLAKSQHNPLIISGLAYGIDITAHKAALKHGLPTVAVLAHGLKSIYPVAHARYAKEIAGNGSLVTEFTSDVFADRAFFVKRNRIVAGLADATIVIESGEKGGALITADLANSYNRDVFAVPGRINDTMSKGCNKLIKTNKAILLEDVGDLEYQLGWEQTKNKAKVVQRELFVELNDDEKVIIEAIRKNNEIAIDNLCFEVSMPVSKVSPLLLGLEFSGLIKSLPGKIYKPV